MRLNGGVIGASNQPTNRAAPGIWSAEELRTNQLYGRFPRYYEGWDLTYLINSSPALLSTTSLSGIVTSSGIDFKPDGTRMYVLDSGAGGELAEFALSTAWDSSTASLSSVSADTTVGQGVAIRSDGRAFFACGTLDPSVRMHIMTTPWTASTAVRGNFVGISAEEASPTGLAFKPDGTRMYVIGGGGDAVLQYSLSTPWSVSTATYDNISFSISSQELNPTGITFSADGTNMYIIGTAGDDVNQYTLSTAWDLSTVSFVQRKVGPDANPQDVFFKPDGTKMYIVGLNTASINEYSLSTAWDVSTATGPTARSVSAQETDPRGVSFKSDGTRMYVVGTAGVEVNEYSLSTPWTISTTSFVRLTSVSTETATPQALSFNDDGTRMYVLEDTNKRVLEYDLRTAWDISTKTYATLPSSLVPSPNDIYFKSDGTKMYSVSASTDTVREYDLSAVWDISTATYLREFSIVTQITGATGLGFSSDGLSMYVSDTTKIAKYNLVTAWDVSTAVFSYITTIGNGSTGALKFKDSDDSKLYLVGTSSVLQYNLGTPKELRSPGDERVSISIQAQDASPQDVAISNDGYRIYMLGGDGDDVNQYNLSVPWDLSSAVYNSTFSISAEETTPSAIRFKTDGTRMFISGTTGDDINEYSLSTPWEVTSASYLRNFSVAAQEANVGAIEFSPDGLNLYVLGTSGDDVNQYTLTTAWNISTASFVQLFSISGQETNPTGLAFRPDGLRMFIIGSVSDAVHQYDLTTPWNISTASYVKSFSVAYLDISMSGISFKTDGTKMYLVGATAPDAIYELNLG
jgi:sugar lactone lactonase YvrE